jgi:hypothetical protein
MLARVRCTPTQRLICAGRAALLVNGTPRISRAAVLGWEPREADAEGPVVGDG